MDLILAITLGTLFGFALNRVGATNPQNIINMLRLTDLHLMKTILFAIGVSSLLLFIGLALGIFNAEHLSVKATYSGVVIGGALLGIGFAVAGYCPGTGLCAAATGRLDGWVFVIGGLLGAWVYTLHYESVAETGFLDSIVGGKATLAETDVESYTTLLPFAPGWLVAGGVAVLLISIAAALPKFLLKE
jgi:uncharacterized membrane protein YedE/YeeE